MSECPQCGESANKVIYMGFPMHLCSDGWCNCLFGFWAFLAEWFPIATDEGEFKFAAYTGSYPRALWRWMTQ